MVDEVELSDEEQKVLHAVATLEQEGEATTAQAIAGRVNLDDGTVRSALSRLVGDADLLRELDPDAAVVGPRYSVKGKPSPR